MGRKGKRQRMAAAQLAAAGRKSCGQFGSKKEPEPEPEEAVSDDEEPFECNPLWFDGAEAGPDDDDSTPVSSAAK